MTDAWDGRPQNPEQSGMHLLRARLTGHLTGWYWNATTERFHHEHVTLGRAASIERYVYECPILTPAEVEACVAEARRDALEEAARIADNHAHGSDKTFKETIRKASAAGNVRQFDLAAACAAGMDHEARNIAAAIRGMKEQNHD